MNNTKAKYDIFQAIADPKRRKIIKLLADNKKSIKSITQDFNISRTAVNKHLNILYQDKKKHFFKPPKNTIKKNSFHYRISIPYIVF